MGDYSSKITSGTYSINVTGIAGSAGAVAWGNVSGKPAAMTNMTSKGVRAYELGCGNSYNEFSCDNGGNGYIDYADSAGYATSAGSANGVAWGNVSGRPTALSQFTNDSGFQTAAGSVNYATSAGSATNAGNADTVDGLHAHGGRNSEANKLVRTDGNGYLLTGYINSDVGADLLLRPASFTTTVTITSARQR